jgi:purine-nucleoside/S-methyl-5'-thioadenosine phosphorylase / adenosine deaminase
VIRWEQPGYVVGFTTRVGGVSEGPWASLNLGKLNGDDPARVDENRRRACEALGLDAATLTMNWQVHSTLVHRARPDGSVEQGDGLWTDAAGESLLALTADCLPIAIARRGPERRLAVLHAGWRGLADGIVEAGVAAVDGETEAVIGPGIGPCCYEVGPEVSERFDADLTRNRLLDLWTAAERKLRAAGVARVERLDLCTRCHPELFFSHRLTGKPRGTHGVIGALA